MTAAIFQLLKHSIRARLIAMSSAMVVGVVCLLTCVIALLGAHSLRQESERQLAQGLQQGTALLSNFLDARESNLDLWSAHPLVEAIFSDTALAELFLPNLGNYFSKIKRQEPWIAHLFLVHDQRVLYSDQPDFGFSRDADGFSGALSRLGQLAPRAAAIVTLRQLDGRPDDRPLLLLKRQLSRKGEVLPGASVLLLMDLGQIQQKLFGPMRIGAHGFMAIAAAGPDQPLQLAHMAGAPAPELAELRQASRQWRSFADIPEQYGELMLASQALSGLPLAVIGVASRDDVRAPVLKLVSLSAGLGLLALLLGVLCAIYLSNRLSEPIRKLTFQSEQLARYHSAGQGQAPALSGGADELGRLANSFAHMQWAIREKIDLIESQNEQLRKSDLARQELNKLLERKVEERTRQLQQALLDQRAISAELQEKNLQLDRLAITDRLTGLSNRLRLDQVLEEEYQRSLRHGSSWSLILIDVDHFKLTNDSFGHQAGDAVLQEIASLLAGATRELDVVGRWGGEEFLVICRDTELDGAARLAEKLRACVAGHQFAIGSGKTCSAGVACMSRGDSIAQLIGRADQALYRAKAGGRNRVETAVPAGQAAA